ncbi:hypothetical protein [Corynebacterium diphtheriae]|nr:hypothetical protein [Corynebacterium diphtheriae]
MQARKLDEADKAPTAFVFDSGSDTWTTVSWEQLAASNYEGFACAAAP